jgi:hypothetical protein
MSFKKDVQKCGYSEPWDGERRKSPAQIIRKDVMKCEKLLVCMKIRVEE